MKYEYKTEPKKHQITALRKAWGKPGFAYFPEMGCGKTKIVIDETAALFEQDKINALIVFAPKGAYFQWVTQIKRHLPDRIRRKIIFWRSGQSEKFFPELDKPVVTETLYVVIINIEALSMGTKGVRALDEVQEKFPDSMLVVDESVTIKSHKSKRTKVLIAKRNQSRYRRLMSGLPNPQDILDFYTQFYFLDPDILGFRSYYAFRGHYAITKRMKMGPGGHTFEKVTGFKQDRMPELQERMAPYMFRITKKECLDLPQKIYSVWNVELSEEQQQAYRDMKDYLMTSFGDDEDVTIDTILGQIIRLHQIVCGHLPLDSGEMKILDNKRIGALLEILEQCSRKVIIWTTYIQSIKTIYEAISKAYSPESVRTYYGATKTREREQTVLDFQDHNGPVQFLITNKAGAKGLDLTEATTCIYYSNSWNLDDRTQSEDRAHRIGQHNPVCYIDMVTPGTIDVRIKRALEKKEDLAKRILEEDWREWL
jgi:SNF2 family DNA or RNA helicase